MKTQPKQDEPTKEPTTRIGRHLTWTGGTNLLFQLKNSSR